MPGKSLTFLRISFLTCKIGIIAWPVCADVVNGQDMLHAQPGSTAPGTQ